MQETVQNIKTIIAKKVIGKIEPCHDERGHHYKFVRTSKIVDSVTTKLILDKPHLVKWAVKMGFEWMEREERWKNLSPVNRDEYLQGACLAYTEVRDDAGSVGHQGHQAIEDYVNNWLETGAIPNDIRDFCFEAPNVFHTDKKPYDSRAVAVARAAEALFKSRPTVVPVASEILVGLSRYNSAGTLDMLVFDLQTGELELWDWKSSNYVKDEYAMQVAGAYKKFFEGMTKLKIAHVRIMHLSKESDKFTVYNVPDCDGSWKAFKAISGVYDWLNDGRAKLLKDVKRGNLIEL